MRRVAITGAALVSPVSWEDIVAGRSGVRAFEWEDLQINKMAWLEYPDDALDPCTSFALDAAGAAIGGRDVSGFRTACIMGSGRGGQITSDRVGRRLYREGAKTVHPLTIPRSMPNAPASHISMKYGITGPCFAVSSACASSSHAIGLGMMMIRSGLVDKAVVGGAEAMRSYATLKGWEAIRAVSPTLSRPFSRDRNGMVIGEGAAVFVLEADKPGIEVAGFGMSADAGDIISPSLGGPVAAMSAALHDAGMFPPDIGYINAHGTGTPLNDKNEAAAIRQVFSKPPLVSSTKPAHGHTIGAAGAIELYVAMKALETGIAPPTLNFTEADPECGLDCVPNVSARFNGSAVASNSFAFGGLNSCLILRG